MVQNMSSFLKRTVQGKNSRAGFLDYTPESTKKCRVGISSFTKGKHSSGKKTGDNVQEAEGGQMDDFFVSSRRKLRLNPPFTPPKELLYNNQLDQTGLQKKMVFDSHPSPPPSQSPLLCAICSVSVKLFRVELSCCPNTALCQRCFDKFYLKERAKDARCPYCKTKEALRAITTLAEPDSDTVVANVLSYQEGVLEGRHLPFSENRDNPVSF